MGSFPCVEPQASWPPQDHTFCGRWWDVTRTLEWLRAALARVLGSRQLLRLKPLLPSSARRRLQRIASRSIEQASTGGLVEDWSSPLLPGPVAPIEANAANVPWSVAPQPVMNAPDGALRCLLATSDLDVGGLDEVVAFLARHLRPHGLQTAVLHTCKTRVDEQTLGRLACVLSDAGIEVVKLSEDAGRRWIKDWQPDVISAHGAHQWVLDESRSLGIPYVDVLHGMHSHFGVDWAAEQERARDIAAIVAVSELVRQQYLAGAPDFPAERIVTIPNSVDAERRAGVERSVARAALGVRDEFLFVSLARHCVQKNTFGLVSAFDEVAAAHPEAHLLVAGRPDDPLYCARVGRLHRSLRSRHRIHLRDHAADPALVLSAADCFVLDSFFEGWSLASMEALYAGVPVVVSDVGGAREQVGDDGTRGYLVTNPLGDPLAVNWKSMRSVCYEPQPNREEFVAAMRAVVANRDRWARRREELAAESQERFHPDRCARAHAALLRSLADKTRDDQDLEARRGVRWEQLPTTIVE